MKKILLSLFMAGFALAASAQTLKEELQYIQEIWGKEKKTLVNEAIKLNGEQANKFWPLYDEYQVERQKFGQKRLDAIKMYSDNFETMTDAKAEEITKMVLDNNLSLDKLQSKYYKKMVKAVGAIKATQFIQLEGYIDSQIKAAISDALPFFPDPKN
jgi:5'-deoxynucleotidase YfbR-like HD superfamily hydrolase